MAERRLKRWDYKMDIGLPNVPDSDRKPSTVVNLLDALRKHYSKERKNIHVSDITGCMRKQVFSKLDPRPLTEAELNNFSSGRGIDGAIEDLTRVEYERYRQKPELWISIKTAEPIFWFDAGPDDICAHPDIWDRELNIPIEGKSNKTETIWMDKFNTMTEPPPASNVKQLLYYMAMANKTYGRLLIQYLNQKKKSPWREVDYTRTPEELKKIREDLAARARQYKMALEAKDPAMALHVMDDRDENFLCKTCPYVKQCLEINKRVKK